MLKMRNLIKFFSLPKHGGLFLVGTIIAVKYLSSPKAVKVVGFETNHFDRLPEAMVIEILNKLVHLKHLLRCSVVCKRFGSLIYQVETICIRPRDPSELRKFSAIRSLRISLKQFPGPLVESKVMFRAHFGVIFVVIAPEVHKFQNAGGPSEDGNIDQVFDELMVDKVRYILLLRFKMHDMTRIIVSDDLPLLDQLSIDVSCGKFYMGKDEISELRIAKNWFPSETYLAKMFHGRLELPTCERVIPRAHIAVVRPQGEEIVMERDLDLMLGSFGTQNDDYDDNDHEDVAEKIIDEVVIVLRKKIASDPNGDFITVRQLSVPKNLFGR